MFCRNCDAEMNENAVVCVKYGIPKGEGNSYCSHYAKETNENAAVCLDCGCSLKATAKSKLVAGLLGIFLGGLGIHNFYLGYTKKAIIQLLLSTVGWFLFFLGPIISSTWALVEAVFIFIGRIDVDGKGTPLRD